ncbi:hypothetical protein PAL_GLEAN10017822 [Pteropus alecto]|uniref:Uncharacterized protein n=1 Tax=Pteropus alecto TaxID=9402 RepID=L5KY13_PTEAL|nr:hypothetical protein PAL_GLEAN10017822 [Pteropus alecto]
MKPQFLSPTSRSPSSEFSSSSSDRFCFPSYVQLSFPLCPRPYRRHSYTASSLSPGWVLFMWGPSKFLALRLSGTSEMPGSESLDLMLNALLTPCTLLFLQDRTPLPFALFPFRVLFGLDFTLDRML